MTDERGGKYFREARFFLAGDKVVAQSHIGEARQVLGYLRDRHAFGGPPVLVQYATLKDGTQIKATMMNGQYQAVIVSPGGRPKRVVEGYEVWVRPYWNDLPNYDWLVEDDPATPYGVITTKEDPRYYSNRMWQASDNSIHCIIGGGDDSRYFGAPGQQISVDGEVVYEGINIVGTAMFGSDRVVVTSVLTYNSGTQEETVTFTVEVGSYMHSTPALSAITYGYLRGDGSKRFSQNTVIFNSDGSEGACVLGDTTVLKFNLTRFAGNVSCAHTLSEIPGTDATVAFARGATGNTRSDETFTGGSISCSHTIVNTDAYTTYSGHQYTVAFACDYSPDDVLVFGLLRYDNTARVSSTGSTTQVFTWETCHGGATPTTRSQSLNINIRKFESAVALTQPGIDCTIVSTLHGDLVRSREGLETEQVGSGSLAVPITKTVYALDTVMAVDLRHGFVVTRGTDVLVATQSLDVVADDGLGTLTLQQVTATAARGGTRFGARFHNGVEAVAMMGSYPSSLTTGAPFNQSNPNYSDPSGACKPCEGNYTVSNTYPVVVAPSDPAVPVRTIARPPLFPPDLLWNDPRSYGFVYPGQDGDWSQALAFFTPAEGEGALSVYSVHSGGGQDVSAEFNLGTRIAAYPTTKHFGVIHTRKTEQ